MRARREIPRLTAITSLAAHPDLETLARAVRSAALAGLPAVLLRAHELSPGARMELALRLRESLEGTDARLFVSRDLEAARAVAADGVHLGERGPSLEEARRAAGEHSLLGWSAHSEAEALRAFEEGADYVFFSPIFETPAKSLAGEASSADPPAREPVGLERLAALARMAPGKVIALGGIDAGNAAEAIRAGAAGVALLRAILPAPDPGAATRATLERISEPSRSPG